MANEREFETFYVLDLDRTLFDTAKATRLMQSVLTEHDPQLAALLEQRYQESSRAKESFLVYDFIVDAVGEAGMKKIQAAYAEAAQDESLLLPGVEELLEFISSQRDVGVGVLTYGSREGQEMKLRSVVELGELPYSVTPEPHKGRQIAAWRSEAGMYHIPDELGKGATRSIVLVDDKPVSFVGVPDDVVGYLVPSIFKAEESEIPAHVKTVANLYEVVAHELSRDTI